MANQIDDETAAWLRQQFEGLANALSNGVFSGGFVDFAHGALLALADVGRRLGVLDEVLAFSVVDAILQQGPRSLEDLTDESD